MANTITVAVTGPSGDVGHGIISGLRHSLLPIRILGLDRSDDFSARRMCFQSVRMPSIFESSYVATLTSILVEHQVDFLMPGIDAEIPILSDHRPFIEEQSKCRVLVADADLIIRCADKLHTANWLSDLDIAVPKTWSIESLKESDLHDLPLPLIMKPRCGHSSIGVRTVTDRKELISEFRDASPGDCLQEYLPGDEFTCGLLFDRTGKLCDWSISRRELAGGRTVLAQYLEDSDVDAIIQRFGEVVETVGALNLQLRIDKDGRPRIFEINPRMSGSTSMRIHGGINDPARLIENLVDGTPIERTSRPGRVVQREWRTVTTSGATRPPATDGRTAIVLDCGGTLLDLLPGPEAICQRVLQDLGHFVPLQMIERAFSATEAANRRKSSAESSDQDRRNYYQSFNSELIRHLGLESLESKFQPEFYERCSSGIMHWLPLPDVPETLHRLSEEYRLFVLANWDGGLQKLLDRNELSRFFDAIFDSATLGSEKPSPAIFERFLDATGLAASECIYIGNEYEADVVGSRVHGFEPILIDTREKYPAEVDCCRVVSWKQVMALLCGGSQDA